MSHHICKDLMEIAKRMPDKIAFSDTKTSLTFGELDECSRKIATYLLNRSLKKEAVVIFAEKAPLTLAGFFGVVYSGNFYVPVDKDMPKHRIKSILSLLKPAVILTDESNFDMAKTISEEELSGEGSMVLLSSLSEVVIEEDKIEDSVKNSIDIDPIYMIFTSGSTGVPKGILVNHRSVLDYVTEISKVLEVSEETIFGNQAPLTVDACLKEILPSIRFGGSTYFIPKSHFMFPVKLIEFLNEYKINTTCWVSTAYHMISSLGALDCSSLPYLKIIAFGSEILHVEQFQKWQNALPKAKFVHFYGPTEATGMSTFYVVPSQFEDRENLQRIPIGRPFPNTEVLLLDEDFQKITSPYMVGEMFIRGTCLTMGYYQDPERTAEAFIQNPAVSTYVDLLYRTGDLAQFNKKMDLVYLSRKDFQIKHLGYRLELSEVELVANQYEDLLVSCALYLKEEKQIVLYYVGNLTPKDLLLYMKKEVPRYMVPSQCIPLREMPLLPNGKLNRAQLQELAARKNT